MTKAVWGARIKLAGVLLIVMASASCGELTRQGTASSYLVVRSLEAASGAEPGTFTATLLSDVITVVDTVPTVFNDLGRVTFELLLKDPGGSATPANPTPNNWITVDRYHVDFIRADGRNTPGVDVPYSFDGAISITVSGTATSGFTLVRHTAKGEAPLAALGRSPVIISTLADVTFYGHDQTGREVSVKARIGIDFGNFADPQ